MDREIKKAIKRFLLLDDVLESSGSIWSILDEVEEELEDMFGKPKRHPVNIEELLKVKKELK